MKRHEQLDIRRGTIEYQEGCQAWYAGETDRECPYPIGNGKRIGWMTGWLDGRTSQRLCRVFQRWAVTWPH